MVLQNMFNLSCYQLKIDPYKYALLSPTTSTRQKSIVDTWKNKNKKKPKPSHYRKAPNHKWKEPKRGRKLQRNTKQLKNKMAISPCLLIIKYKCPKFCNQKAKTSRMAKEARPNYMLPLRDLL